MTHSSRIFCFKQMLTLQEAMNVIVHPDWRHQGFVWYRAIWTECAELIDHLGWKWWKKQDPNWQQVHLELIDIWHFGLSQLLQTMEDHDQLSHYLEEQLAKIEMQHFAANDLEALRHQIELFAQHCLATHTFSVELFYPLLKYAGLSLEDLYRHYVGKNVLNRFRQDKGYKQGHYIKEWRGQEDNEHLAEILLSIDIEHPDILAEIYQQLEEKYPS